MYDSVFIKELADRLYRTGGKKQYGYLKADVKAIVNRIGMELSADERIAALYDLWYEQREKVLSIYTQDLPERVPLVDNEEFKSVKNTVIQEAMNILAEITPIDEDTEDIVLDTPEPPPEEMEQAEQESESAAPMSDRERISVMWRYYRQAKELLDRESEDYDPDTAVDLLIDSAKLGCDVAKYRLGKMFLRGDDVAKNTDYALRWLEDAVADGNQYAEYLLGKTLLRGEDTEQDLPRAEDLLKRSSAKGNRYAKYALGKAYLEGVLLLQDIPEAIRLLTESADTNFAPAQYLLGKLMSQGEVMPKYLERAIDYLEQAAGQGNPYAAYLAGKLLLTEEDIKDTSHQELRDRRRERKPLRRIPTRQAVSLRSGGGARLRKSRCLSDLCRSSRQPIRRAAPTLYQEQQELVGGDGIDPSAPSPCPYAPKSVGG